jgi:hypothetical protein
MRADRYLGVAERVAQVRGQREYPAFGVASDHQETKIRFFAGVLRRDLTPQLLPGAHVGGADEYLRLGQQGVEDLQDRTGASQLDESRTGVRLAFFRHGSQTRRQWTLPVSLAPTQQPVDLRSADIGRRCSKGLLPAEKLLGQPVCYDDRLHSCFPF